MNIYNINNKFDEISSKYNLDFEYNTLTFLHRYSEKYKKRITIQINIDFNIYKCILEYLKIIIEYEKKEYVVKDILIKLIQKNIENSNDFLKILKNEGYLNLNNNEINKYKKISYNRANFIVEEFFRARESILNYEK
jgi:hypothetical protein